MYSRFARLARAHSEALTQRVIASLVPLGYNCSMKFAPAFSGTSLGLRAFPNTLERWFPMPQMLLPRAVGVDISDSSIKWLVLEGPPGKRRIHSYGQEPLEHGIVVDGTVHDVPRLAAALSAVKLHAGGIDCAHAALPEEAAYVFSMRVVEGSSRAQILSMIEFEFEARVPIAPKDAVYDFNIIAEHGEGGEEIGVVVFPRDLAETYVAAFSAAGIQLLSLEIEARSIARAVSSGTSDEPITLLVDFGRARTGFAVLKRGIPIFTSTVTVGGDAMTRAIMEKLGLSEEEAVRFNDEQGLLAEGGRTSPGAEALSGVAASLADEVARHYHYWDTRRNERGERMTPVERVFLVGGSANLKGLCDYISARVQAETIRPDVWQHVSSLDDYIPQIDRRTSLQYATAVGLALRGM